MIQKLLIICTYMYYYGADGVNISLIHSEVRKWCYVYHHGVIYTLDQYYACNRMLWKGPDRLIKKKLDGRILRVATLVNKPDYHFDCHLSYDQHGTRLRDCYSLRILEMLSTVLDFKIEFVQAETWGRDLGNGTWTGMIGLVQRGKVDLAVCHTTVTRERFEVVDFLLPTLKTSRCLIYQAERLPLTQDVFVITFPQSIWICFMTCLILVAVFFKLSTYIHSTIRPDHEPWSWTEVTLWSIAAVCQQSYSKHPKGSSCRTMFLIGYLITYLMYTGFAAGVTSQLAVQWHDTHLTVMDVVVMKLKLVLPSYGTHLEFLNGSTDPYARSLSTNLIDMIRQDQVEDFQQFFEKMNKENHVGLATSTTYNNYLRNKVPIETQEKMTESKIEFSQHHKSFMIPKYSPHKELFNYWLLRFKETGILDLIRKRSFLHSDNTCCKSREFSSAGLGNVLSAAFILGGGMFLSWIILLFEVAWKKKTTDHAWEIVSKQEVWLQLQKNQKK